MSVDGNASGGLYPNLRGDARGNLERLAQPIGSHGNKRRNLPANHLNAPHARVSTVLMTLLFVIPPSQGVPRRRTRFSLAIEEREERCL